MPDICKNDLTISGDAKELRKFLKAVRTDEHPFNFAGVHPPPERLAAFPDSCSDDEELTDAQLRQTAEHAEDEWDRHIAELQLNMRENRRITGYESLRDWQVKNWGTKWGAFGSDCWFESDKGTASIEFETAWRSPTKFFLNASRKFPKLRFRNCYRNEYLEFGVQCIQSGTCAEAALILKLFEFSLTNDADRWWALSLKDHLRIGDEYLLDEVVDQFLDWVGAYTSVREIDSVQPEAAACLARTDRTLRLNGVKKISGKTAWAFAEHAGKRLELRGLKRIDAEVATALSEYKGYLGLGGLEAINLKVARILSEHQGTLELTGLERLSPKAAECLAEHRGRVKIGPQLKLPRPVSKPFWRNSK